MTTLISPLSGLYENHVYHRTFVNKYDKLYKFSAQLQRNAGRNNTLEYFENTVVPKMYEYLHKRAPKQNKEIRLSNYLLYYINVTDELPKEIMYDT